MARRPALRYPDEKSPQGGSHAPIGILRYGQSPRQSSSKTIQFPYRTALACFLAMPKQNNCRSHFPLGCSGRALNGYQLAAPKSSAIIGS